jgi:hypothetical protein
MITSTLRRTAVVVALATATSTLVGTSAAVADLKRPSPSGVATVRTPEPPQRRLPTSLSIRVATPRVRLDGTDTIIGRLRSYDVPLARKRVLLLSQTEGATKWAFEGAHRTRARGKVRFVVRPEVNTRYRLAFLGTRLFRASRSDVVRVLARPTALSIAVDPAVIDPGGSSTVSGVLTFSGEPFSGKTVWLRSKLVGSDEPFTTEAMTTSGADGSVSFTVTPAASRRYVLLLPRTTGVPAARSAVATVFVRVATSLSIRGRVTTTGYNVSGNLRGGGMPLVGRWVTLQKQLAGETTWNDVATKRTGRHGHVAFRQPLVPGTSYRLSYAGGARFAPCVSGTVVS